MQTFLMDPALKMKGKVFGANSFFAANSASHRSVEVGASHFGLVLAADEVLKLNNLFLFLKLIFELHKMKIMPHMNFQKFI